MSVHMYVPGPLFPSGVNDPGHVCNDGDYANDEMKDANNSKTNKRYIEKKRKEKRKTRYQVNKWSDNFHKTKKTTPWAVGHAAC